MLGKHMWADMNAPPTTATYSTQGSDELVSHADGNPGPEAVRALLMRCSPLVLRHLYVWFRRQ